MYINNLPKYTNASDKRVLQRLVSEALALGHKVSVHDGEEFAVKRSTDFKEIIKGCASTGEDTIIIRDQNNEKLGSFYLIYDNGNEDDAMVLIADYSANDFSDMLYNMVSSQITH